ncbi:MAG: multidrug effflux MFS transporter [Pseudomonadota bacterium]
MNPSHTPPKLITLIFLTAISTLSLNMFLPSLASIAADLDADYALVSLAVGLYLGVTAIVKLVVGPLSDRLGRRPVLLTALVVFAAASVICALAQDVWTFLAFRVLQGGVVAGSVLSLAVVRDTTSERKAAGLIGYISMAMAIAPMLGPMLGGLLDTMFGWRANFWFYAVSGLVLLALCWIDLGETLDREQERGTSILRETAELLRAPRFWAFALCMSFSTGAFYIFLAGAPLVAASTFGVSTATLGIFVGSITAGFMTGSAIAGRLAGNFDPMVLMIVGRCVACGGILVGILLVVMGVLTPLTYFGTTIFVGLGNGITMPGCSAGAMSVRPKLAGTAAGVSGALTVAAGAVLTTFTGLVISAESGALTLLTLMFLASLAGLFSAVWAHRSSRLKSRLLSP